MFVTDRQEYLGTSGCPELNSREKSDRIVVMKPCIIRSRVSRIHKSTLALHTHTSLSKEVYFILVYVFGLKKDLLQCHAHQAMQG